MFAQGTLPCYASAKALADDLHLFLAGKPIRARPTPIWEHAWKWSRRRPAIAGLSLGLVVVIVVAFLLVLNASHEASANARAEKAARQDAEHLLAGSYLDQGIHHCERGSIGAGMLWMVRSLDLAAQIGDENVAHAARANLAAWRQDLIHLRASLPNDDWVSAVAFSPDGKLALTGNKDKTARLWDVATGQPIGLPFRHDYPVWAVAFSPDGQTILTGSGDDEPFYADHDRWTVATDSGGRRFHGGAASKGEARLWDLRTGKQEGAPLPHPGSVASVQFSRDGRLLLTVGAWRGRSLAEGGRGKKRMVIFPRSSSASGRSLDGFV